MSGDGAAQGISAERALETILGGKEPPNEMEERGPLFWRERLLAKDDNINGYEEHAEVMAKYIMLAIARMPGLAALRADRQHLVRADGKTDWNIQLVPGLDEPLKLVYPDEKHPFRQAYSQATGFSWGWAVNMARFALELPPVPNPAILEIG